VKGAQDIDEQRYAQNQTPYHFAVASSIGIGSFGKPVLTLRTFLNKIYHEKPIPNGDFVALMRTLFGFTDQFEAPHAPRAICSRCQPHLAKEPGHQMTCIAGDREKKQVHYAAQRLLFACFTEMKDKGEFLEVVWEPAYHGFLGNENRADILLRRPNGEVIYLDFTSVETAVPLARGSSSYIANDGVQKSLKIRGWGGKKQKYEQCRRKHGNGEGVDDVIPIVTDSTGTLYSESADWLKKNLSEKMWKRFRWEASEIFT